MPITKAKGSSWDSSDQLETYNSGVARTLKSKLEDFVSVKDFGAVGDGITDDTTAIQNAINTGKPTHIPVGTYKISTITFSSNSQGVFGDGPSKTILNSTVTAVGATAIKNSDQTTTRLFCFVKELQVNCSSLPVGYCIDWKSMQFGRIKNVWVYGGGAGCFGIRLDANWTTTECTYNHIEDCYIGNIGKGISYGDGANSNTVTNTRIQPLAGGYGHFVNGTASGRTSNNTAVGGGVEYAGAVSSGFYLGLSTDVFTIVGVRFEYLLTGVEAAAGSQKAYLLGNYYSSCTADYALSGSGHIVLENGGLTLPNTASSSATELDYYQRGVFTPTIAGSSTAGVGTYTTQLGQYTRVGNRVTCDIQIAWTAHTGTGNLLISNLPFTIKNSGISVPALILPENLTYSNSISGIGIANTTNISVYSFSSAAAAAPVALDTSASMYVQISYSV